MTASFFDHQIICDKCGKPCTSMVLKQEKDAPLFEFDGEAIHVECYVRLLVDAQFKKLTYELALEDWKNLRKLIKEEKGKL